MTQRSLLTTRFHCCALKSYRFQAAGSLENRFGGSVILRVKGKKMGRKFIVGGNWKMNGSKRQIDDMINNLKNGNLDPNVEVVLGVPSIYLSYVKSIIPDNISVAAQNCWKVLSGAFTGEISPSMLIDVGVNWVILGHSERRTIFGESDDLVANKVLLAIESGLNIILCVGETLQEREAGKTEEVIFRQLRAVIPCISDKWNQIVIAYEPVWAIGTGKTASPQQAQDVHASLRTWLSKIISPAVADAVRIQYGGSVTASNAKELAACPDIDGFLVGGASLKPEFVDIVNATK